jgi:N-succinyl-L-ornithine transcarbamylase
MSLLKNKKFTSVHDVADINGLVEKALAYKANPLQDTALGAGKRIGLLFLNPSLRTRLSTQIAASNLGMEAIVFNVDKEGWQLEFAEGAVMNGSKSEHIKDAAPILGSYFDILCIRSFPTLTNRSEDYSELFLSEFIKYCGCPVISMESATRHPLQSLADVITIQENRKSKIENRKLKVELTWAPHVKPLPQSVSNSFAEWLNAWSSLTPTRSKGEGGGFDFVIAYPEKYELAEEFTQGATLTHNQAEALQGADFIYVKNWSAYNDYGKILCNDMSWMLTLDKLKQTNNAKVMHCLPVRRNVELSDEILDSANCITTQEAGNRVWAAQAVIASLIPPKEGL